MAEYLIHGKKIEWDDDRELGIYRNWNERNPVGYAASNIEGLVQIANILSPEDALAGAKKMRERASMQAGFDYGFDIPQRFMAGIRNSEEFYKRIMAALEPEATKAC